MHLSLRVPRAVGIRAVALCAGPATAETDQAISPLLLPLWCARGGTLWNKVLHQKEKVSTSWKKVLHFMRKAGTLEIKALHQKE